MALFGGAPRPGPLGGARPGGAHTVAIGGGVAPQGGVANPLALLFWVNPRDYGAKADGVADDAPAIMAAHNALPPGGGMIVLGSGLWRIASTLTFTKHIRLAGAGRFITPGGAAATVIRKAASLNGPAIVLAGGNDGNGSLIESLVVEGEGGNGGDGICIRTNYCGVRDVTVLGMGQDGIRIGEDGVARNTNLWRLDNILVTLNGRHGVNIDDPAGVPDCNAGTLTHLDATDNGGDGLRVGKCDFCTFVGITPQVNDGIGIHLTANARRNSFHGGDPKEANVGGNIVIDAGALENSFFGAYQDNVAGQFVDNGTRTLVVFPGGFVSRQAIMTAPGGATLIAFADMDTTPSVRAGSYFQFANTGATSVTDFDDGIDGQLIVLRLNSLTTLVHAAALMRLKGAVNLVGASSDHYVCLLSLNGIWFEQWRNF